MAIFKVTAVPDFSQLKSEIAKLQSSPVTLGVDTRQANVNIKATTKEIKNVGKAAKETSGFADLMGKSFSRIVLQMATWQMLGNAIAGVKRSFVEALDTMKSVDDEMVTIRKVTGATTAELNKIEKQAYDTASAYGVAADEYLQFVSGFSRAGYGEQASALAELAAKTQIVGDTNAETAQQFLLSVDAAYKYQGNIKQLTKVLDGANEIDNKYATSIQKVAEGLGKVAPIAAQAHVGVDELTAAIGTITAVTQRSGTEASTALRALFLNIIGDTKTEIDEGVTWTTGEIAGLRDVIKVYAKDAYDAAQATGSVINPMKAIAGLSKSMKDGLLTEQQLMEMVSDIGGKLRTSQLLALIQNWDMYESMLTDFAGAAGSADKEVENALDSWTRKTEILKNKWTQFISHLVETDTIKGALDGVIGLVELLDSEGGHLLVTIGGITAAVLLLGQAKKAVLGSEVVKDVKAAITAINALKDATVAYAAAKEAAAAKNHAAESALTFLEADRSEGAAKGLGKLGTAILNLGLSVGQLGLIAAGIAGLVVVVKSLADANDKANRSMSDFDTEIGETNEQLKANKERLDEINSTPWNERSVEIIKEKNALEEENEALQEQLELLKKQKLEKAQNSTGEGFRFGFTNGSEAYETILNYLDKYTEQLERTGQVEESQQLAFEKTTEAAAIQVEMLQYLKDTGQTLTSQEEALIAAYERLGSVIPDTTDAMAEHVSGLLEEARQSGATGKALYDLVAAQITASNTKLNFSQQVSALRELAIQAGYSASAVASVFAFSDTSAMNQIRAAATGLMRSGKAKTSQEAMKMAKQNYIDNLWGSLNTFYKPSGGGSYVPSPGSAAKSKQNELDNARRKAAQATIDVIRKQMKAETDAIDEQIDALKKQNEETERGEKLEELKLNILKKQDELLNARNERTVRQYNAATGQWEWVADAEKVKQAQEDLEDAKKDLRDYERDTERELAIEELEAREKAIEAAYQLKIDVWQKLIDQLNGDVETEAALLAASRGDWETYYQEMLKVYQGLLNAAEDYQKKMTAIQSQTPIPGGSVNNGGNADDVNKIIEANRKKENDALANLDRDLASLTPAQRSVYDMWMSRGTGSYYAIDQAKKAPKGNTGGSSGGSTKKTTDTSSPAYTPGGTFLGGYKPTTSGSGGGSTSSHTTRRPSSGGSTSSHSTRKPSGGRGTMGGGKNTNKVSRYDSGGVLHGLGGIKATVDDEMVLPPDVTRKLLMPSSDSRAKEVIAGMRLVLNDRMPYGKSLAGVTNNSADSHDVAYYVNGVSIGADAANSMTIAQVVRDLAEQSYYLKGYRN